VELIVYNILGQKIKTLVNEEKYAGEFQISWDGKNDLGQFVASGIYLGQIKTNQGISTRKIMVMH
jgi:flagellar hook assembly protein FlgD